ncbi:unnamed protein product [Phaedon cochleariae]|uniref:Exocyst complex subunit EXOC6/Sec15 C-terminal domain-containing protein n=1 Tax=Phaedon cochleariae TaxID=80249 RepID=A0A9N9SMQ7_PHACE|nr:unnamed protein product [Phaedon cochleariae]
MHDNAKRSEDGIKVGDEVLTRNVATSNKLESRFRNNQVEVDEMIRKSTNLLLTRTFNGCLSSTFRSPRVNLTEIVQIIVDTGFLEEAHVFLDQFISNITGEQSRGVSSSIDGQSALFTVSREDAVRKICDKLKQKLDEFLELEDYDWLLVEPKGHASSYIADIIAFLQTTFHSFTNIPRQKLMHLDILRRRNIRVKKSEPVPNV